MRDPTNFKTTRDTFWIESTDEDGLTNLQRAVLDDKYHTVCSLLELGANTATEDKEGFTPLDRAILLGHTKTVRLLIENGAKISPQLMRLSAKIEYVEPNILKLLLYSAVEEYPGSAERILEKLLDQKCRPSSSYFKSLYKAVEAFPDISKRILEKLSSNKKLQSDTDYYIALNNAAKPYKQIGTHVAHLLMDQELKLDANYFMALFCKAALSGATKTFALQLSLQPTLITIQDKQGQTITHRLANCLLEIQEALQRLKTENKVLKSWLENRLRLGTAAIKYLIRQGADIEKTNSAGETPRSLLENSGLRSIFSEDNTYHVRSSRSF